MKKLILLFFSLLAIGFIFQACDDTKTYAEMLEEEKDAVNAFIRQHNIKVISVEEFEKDMITNKDEYVLFTNGVYMHIEDRGSVNDADSFGNGSEVMTRFVEHDILANDTTCFNVFLPGTDFVNFGFLYEFPDVFRYVSLYEGTSVYGTFLPNENGRWLGSMYYVYQSTAVPAGWMIPLKYVRSNAHVKLIVPSKMGHETAQKYVYPYFYDIRSFRKY